MKESPQEGSAVEIAMLWIGLSVAVGAFATTRGHAFMSAFLIALLLSPLLGIAIEFSRRPNLAAKDAAAIDTGEMRRCPYCAELVRREAIKCKHCGSAITA